MADLLEQVVAEIQKLPQDQRDAIAARILTDLKDDQAWTERFEATTDEQWDRLAEGQEGKSLPVIRCHLMMFFPLISLSNDIQYYERVSKATQPAFFPGSKASCPGLRTLAFRSLSLQSPIQACQSASADLCCSRRDELSGVGFARRRSYFLVLDRIARGI